MSRTAERSRSILLFFFVWWRTLRHCSGILGESGWLSSKVWSFVTFAPGIAEAIPGRRNYDCGPFDCAQGSCGESVWFNRKVWSFVTFAPEIAEAIPGRRDYDCGPFDCAQGSWLFAVRDPDTLRSEGPGGSDCFLGCYDTRLMSCLLWIECFFCGSVCSGWRNIFIASVVCDYYCCDGYRRKCDCEYFFQFRFFHLAPPWMYNK